MIQKPTSLMLFNKNTITSYIPNTCGVYYLRGIADETSLYPIYYIGKAKPGHLREELLKRYFQNDWPEVVYFNYIECDTDKEAKVLLKQEIARHKPKLNGEESFVTSFVTIPQWKFNR